MISRRNLLTASAGALAASAGIWLANRQGSDQSQLPATPLRQLWQLTLPTPDGKTISLAALQGKPLLINFWATWCAPCVEEMPLLEQFHQQFAAIGLQMLGIAADQPLSVENFLQRTPVNFPILLAGFDGISISKALGNETGGLPHTILISAKGDILFSKNGQLTTNDFKTIANLIL